MGRPVDGAKRTRASMIGTLPGYTSTDGRAERRALRDLRGLSLRLCVVVAALCLLAPSAAAASEPERAYTRVPGSPLVGLSKTGGVAFSPNGRLLAHGTEIFSVGASSAPTPVSGPQPDLTAEVAAFSPNGRLLAAAGDEVTGQMYSLHYAEVVSLFSVGPSGALSRVFAPPATVGSSPTSITFSPNGRLLAVTTGEGSAASLYLFSVGSMGALAAVPGSPYSVSTQHVAFSPRAPLLAAQVKGGLRIFSISPSSALTEAPESPIEVPRLNAIAFRPDGDLLTSSFDVSALADVITTYIVAPAGALTPIASGVGPTGAAPGPGAGFSPDGTMFAYPLMDSTYVNVLSLGRSGAVSVLPGNPFATGPPTRIVFSNKGLLALTSEDGGFDGNVSVFTPFATSASTNWVGALGSEGYDLAGWDGGSDVSDLPNESLSLVKGSRCVFAAHTSDVRALTSPDELMRTAAGYCDPTELQVKLTFHVAYTGDLRLYAVHWGPGESKEHETITVGSDSVLLDNNIDMTNDDFSNGEWAIFPVSEPAGGSLTIEVNEACACWGGALLSGIFLGNAGPPAAMPTPGAPQGNWVGTYGSAGYDLGAWNGESDLASLPSATVGLTQGSRYVWASSTHDRRALQSPDRHTRTAAAYLDPAQIRLSLKFNTAFSGNLHLYAVDWDSQARRELISVNGQTADLSRDFHRGAWVSFPISAAAGETVPIVVDRTAGESAVLSGIFLGGAGASHR
jgi:WD40 repeat protein